MVQPVLAGQPLSLSVVVGVRPGSLTPTGPVRPGTRKDLLEGRDGAGWCRYYHCDCSCYRQESERVVDPYVFRESVYDKVKYEYYTGTSPMAIRVNPLDSESLHLTERVSVC